MDKILKVIKKRQITAIILTVALIVGIPSIIIGATRLGQNAGFVVLMVFGIVATVAGFYGSPVAWVAVGNAKSECTLVTAVETEHLYTVRELSARLNKNERNTSALLNDCIMKGYLVGYLREGDRLILNENTSLHPTEHNMDCPYCGAVVTFTGTSAKCPYCGSALQRRKD